MKRRIAIAAVVALAAAAGYWLGLARDGGHGTSPVDEGTAGAREILYWVAPMDPNYRRDAPGKSPMGMDLVPVYADQAHGEGVVAIDPVVASNLGVRTAPVAFGPLARRIETVGYVTYDEHAMMQVSTRVSGWIEVLHVRASGDPVAAGQPLLELYSPELVSAQEEYLAALRSANARLRAASRERLDALGVTPAEIARLDDQRTVRRRQRLHARHDGVVADLRVLEGAYVTPASRLMTVASLDTVWVTADVPERQAAWVEPNQAVTLAFDHRPDAPRAARIDHVYPELDPRTRTLRARVRIDNPGHALRPNMFARVTIDAAPTAPVMHVPREALIRGQRVDRVVLALGDGRFRSQPVEAGIETGNRVAIVSGLRPDERVVTSAQFLIDSESSVDSALARLDTAPSRVRVGAVVEGWRAAQQFITVDHEPVEAWSWPRMSMGFHVTDAALLEGLTLGERVVIEIERGGPEEYAVTDIVRERAP